MNRICSICKQNTEAELTRCDEWYCWDCFLSKDYRIIHIKCGSETRIKIPRRIECLKG